jgi:phenylacetate-CoA ligase
MMPGLRHWLHRRRRPARYAHLRTLLSNQALSPAALRRKQRADLESIVRFAAAHTAYYRERYAGLPLQGEIDIAALPLLRKEDVVAHLPEMLAAGHDPRTTSIGYTGGSTGKPLAFYYDEAKHELMRAGMMRSYMMAGWHPGEKIANFWGARQDTVAGGVFGGAAIEDFVAAEKTIAAHKLSADRLQEWADFIRRYCPVLLQGYASILAALARHVLDARIAMPTSLRGVFSTAEVLNEWQRELMQEAFGCKVYNQYGSREIPNIACECRHGRMHVFTDMVYLESQRVADEERLLVTSLTNRLMPMIRYENGDSAQLLEETCDCGSPFPLMAMGMCRSNDHIAAPDGRRVHPAYFNGLLYGLTQIESYQFVQPAAGRLVLNVVCATPLAADTAAALRENIRRDVAADMDFEIKYVPEIERSVSGKHRFVISHCA